jgi:hypothetical protein
MKVDGQLRRSNDCPVYQSKMNCIVFKRIILFVFRVSIKYSVQVLGEVYSHIAIDEKYEKY